MDRRSNMANSTMNAPPKKGGAGGGYTWGSPLDVIDFEPVGVTGSVGVVVGTQSLPIVTSPTAVIAGPTTSFQMNQQAFPALGAAPAKVAVSSWGPGAMPQTVVSGAAIRPGAVEVVGQQHPRNLFARKARPQQTQVVATQVQGGMIDWSQSGMPVETMQSIVRQAAHLGPYQTAGTTTLPLDTLRARNIGTTTQIQAVQPMIAKQPIAMQKPTIIQQPR
jgi:hypothetical protein